MEAELSEQPKEMKVKLSLRVVRALRSHKILTGQNISDTVEQAIRAYYASETGR
ncbi:MAG: hypothetical protein ACYDDF_08195 [Thermoplasmatota archaeon]